MPDQKVVVFDEAQRAFDSPKVAASPRLLLAQARSKPQAFVAITERLPSQYCNEPLNTSAYKRHVFSVSIPNNTTTEDEILMPCTYRP